MTFAGAASIIKSYEQGDGSPAPQTDEMTVRCLSPAQCGRIGRGLTAHRTDSVRRRAHQGLRICRSQTVRRWPAHLSGLPGAVGTEFRIRYIYPFFGNEFPEGYRKFRPQISEDVPCSAAPGEQMIRRNSCRFCTALRKPPLRRPFVSDPESILLSA